MSDNIMLVQELLFSDERSNASPRYMAKIDLLKAYDSLNCSFIDELLEEVQFPAAFRGCLM